MAGQCRASRRSPGRDTSPKAVETYGKEHLRSSIWEGWEHKRAGSGGCRDILRILLAHASNWAQCSSASGRILRKETGSILGVNVAPKYRVLVLLDFGHCMVDCVFPVPIGVELSALFTTSRAVSCEIHTRPSAPNASAPRNPSRSLFDPDPVAFRTRGLLPARGGLALGPQARSRVGRASGVAE